MGLSDWFRTFCGNIQVQNGATISHRYKAITRRLNTDFWETTSDMSHSLYVGSYGRNTAIHSTSDVDMIFPVAVLGLQAVRRLQRQRAVSAAASSPHLSQEDLLRYEHRRRWSSHPRTLQ